MCGSLDLRSNSIARVQGRAHALGLNTDHFYERHKEVTFIATPFRQTAQPKHLRTAAIGIASAWFLRRGYMVSIPIEQAPYDLVTESDTGLQRVQVKTATGKPNHGGTSVGIARHHYDAERGRKPRAAYRDGEIDQFFIVTGAGRLYLIPLRAVQGVTQITLDQRYAQFEVDSG